MNVLVISTISVHAGAEQICHEHGNTWLWLWMIDANSILPIRNLFERIDIQCRSKLRSNQNIMQYSY